MEEQRELETKDALYHALKDLKIVDQERLIRGVMYITGVRQVDIARKYNIDKTVLSKVLSGKRKNLKVREAIASELNVPLQMLWPEAFDRAHAQSHDEPTPEPGVSF